MMLSRNTFFTAVLAFLLSSSLADAQYSTTFTTTITDTITSASPTVTVTESRTSPDVQYTTTSTTETTLDAATTTATVTLAPTTTFTTLAAATQTVVDTTCVNYSVQFKGKACCPSRYIHKKVNPHPHPHPQPHPQPSKSRRDEAKSLAIREAELKRMRTQDIQRARNFYPKSVTDAISRRALSGPVPTTSSCTVSSFQGFSTKMGQSTTVLANYDFHNGARMRLQDLYNVNVCGDVYIDGTFAASTTCPQRITGDTSYYTADPDDAINSGKFGYVYVNIPAGVHTVTFTETFQGGAAYYSLASADQCPALMYTDEYSTTVYEPITTTETTTVDPTATQTNVITETSTVTPNALVVTQTSTPAVVTSTVVPSPIQTTVQKCKSVTVTLSCPSYHRASMLNNWYVGQLDGVRRKNAGKAFDVTCASVAGTYEY